MVVIVDKKSGSSEDDVRREAKTLESDKINVIPVAIGNQADRNELEQTTADRNNLITAPTNEDPDVLADKIMGNAVSGKFLISYG